MTLIIKQGTLKVGSILVVGDEYTKVKSMLDDKGNNLKEAYPGDAVQIIGIPSVPAAGDFVYEVDSEVKARHIASKRKLINSSVLQNEQDKSTVKTAKIKLDYKSRKRLYGSAGTDSWLTVFQEK